MKRWMAFLPLAVLVALGLLFAFYGLKRDPQVQPMAMVGKPMPDLVLADLDTGQPVRLRELTAEGPVLVNFFASWCAPCRIEHPELVALSQRGVRLVGVAYKDEPAKSLAFIAELGDPFARKLVDRDGRAGVEFGVTGVPETYVVARDGMIVAKHTGPLDEAQARKLAAEMR